MKQLLNTLFVTSEDILLGLDGENVVARRKDTVVARYEIDRHWTEKNVSVKDGQLYIRLYNRMKGYLDCKIPLTNDTIQKIPQ